LVVEGQAGSVGELLAEVDRICRGFKTDFNAREEIWFRGQARRRWSLQPLLYRSDTVAYLHRVQGAVEQLDGSLKEVSTELEQFLLNINKRISIGIPVGPAASVILAETVLHDIDMFIQSRRPRLEYTRYADDFRVFANSASSLKELWHDLTRYLYRSHRLSLASDKSTLIDTPRFRDRVLSPPGRERQHELGRALGISFDDLAARYATPAAARPDPADLEGTRRAFQELFEIVLNAVPLNIGAARMILRKARARRMRAILQQVVQHFEKLTPVIRDVGLYLAEVLKGSAIARNEPHLQALFARHPHSVPGNLAHEWLAWLITGEKELSSMPAADSFVGSAGPAYQARQARLHGRIGWVRERSAEWSSWASWDRWALLSSATILPEVERRVWMDHVLGGSADFMDRMVAKHVKSL
jgi:hypothetical protein